MRHLLLFFFACGLLPCLARADDSVQLQIARIEDRRTVTTEPDALAIWQNTLEIRLHMSGPLVREAHQAGQIRLEEATDDLGDALQLKGFIDNTMDSTGRWISVTPAIGAQPTTRPDEGPYQLQFVLGSPPRKASRITHLKGDFQVVVGGAPKDVVVPHVMKTMGKEIDDEAVSSAGLSITPSEPAGLPHAKFYVRPGTHHMLGLEVVGNTKLLQDAALVDASGKTVSDPPLRFTGVGEMIYFLDGTKDLDESMSLRVTVIVGQKQVTVPFDFKDVALP